MSCRIYIRYAQRAPFSLVDFLPTQDRMSPEFDVAACERASLCVIRVAKTAQGKGEWPLTDIDAAGFLRGIGRKIDALDTVLDNFDQDETSGVTARLIARSLSDAAKFIKHDALQAAADCAHECSNADLFRSVGDLIRVLRQVAAEQISPMPTTILTVGGDETFLDQLVLDLQQTHKHKVLRAAGAVEAWDMLEENCVALVILGSDLAAPMTSVKFLMQIRENPMSAALPVLVVSTGTLAPDTLLNLTSFADGFIDRPVDSVEACSWVNERSVRAHETVAPALRDSLTGLLNRAAFIKSIESYLNDWSTTQGSLTMGILAIKGLDETSHDADTVALITQGVSLRLSATFRPHDVLGRIAPDTFATLFVGEDDCGATLALKRASHHVARDMFITSGGESVQVHVAIAVICVLPTNTASEVLHRAESLISQAGNGKDGRVLKAQMPASAQHCRIMVMTADKATGAVLEQMFECNGHKTVHVHDQNLVKQEILGANKYDLLVIDGDMNDDVGFATLQSLHDMPQAARLPVVMLLSPARR